MSGPLGFAVIAFIPLYVVTIFGVITWLWGRSR